MKGREGKPRSHKDTKGMKEGKMEKGKEGRRERWKKGKREERKDGRKEG
jgi:hypothetical protein